MDSLSPVKPSSPVVELLKRRVRRPAYLLGDAVPESLSMREITDLQARCRGSVNRS